MTRFVLPAAFGFLIGFGGIAAIDAVVEPDPAPTRVDAEVLVDATAVEMHGYDATGKPGTYTYDCHANDAAKKPDDPSLICTQREQS